MPVSGMRTGAATVTRHSRYPPCCPGNPVRFIAPGSTTLNSAGTGTAFVTCPSGVVWYVELLSVSTSAATPTPGVPQPTASVYFGTEANSARYIESTFKGNGNSSDSRYTVHGGESVCVQWVGGTAGTQATMVMRGTQQQESA